jgi:CRP-like cAMP-binding protein
VPCPKRAVPEAAAARRPAERQLVGPGGVVRPVHDLTAGLSRSYLFENLTAGDLGPLAAVVTTRTLVRDECLCRPGDPADEIWVLLTGEVKDSVVDTEGYEVIHFVHGPGMTLGEPGYFSVERTRIVHVIAVKPSTTLIVLGRRHLDPFMAEHPSIKDRVLEALASNSRWQTAMLSSAARRPLRDRLMLRLLELVDSGTERTSGLAATPKISQSTLAAMIGVSRENVNRTLSALAVDGLVRQEDGRYVLVDEERLRREVSRDWPLPTRRDRRADQHDG